MYLVALWSTQSAQSSRGWVMVGGAQVLSTTTTTESPPIPFASLLSSRMSETLQRGFEGDSSQSMVCAGGVCGGWGRRSEGKCLLTYCDLSNPIPHFSTPPPPSHPKTNVSILTQPPALTFSPLANDVSIQSVTSDMLVISQGVQETPRFSMTSISCAGTPW